MSLEALEKLGKAILEYDREGASKWAKRAIAEKIDPTEAIDAMTTAIREVGEGFRGGDLFLPDLVGAADAMSVAMPIIWEGGEIYEVVDCVSSYKKNK